MKRDMDLVRKILFACEAAETTAEMSEITIDGFDERVVGYHMTLLDEAGLLVVTDITQWGSGPRAKPGVSLGPGMNF